MRQTCDGCNKKRRTLAKDERLCVTCYFEKYGKVPKLQGYSSDGGKKK